MVLTSFKDISGSAEASNLSKISAEASNIFKDISSVLICWFPEGGWEAKGERKPGRLRLCLIVLELKLLNAYDRYPTSLNYLSLVRNAVCILCVSYFGPFLHFFGYLSCAIFFSLLPWRVLEGGLVGVSRVLGSLVSWGRILWEVRIRWLPGMSLVSLHNHSHILPCNGIYDNLKDTHKDKYKDNVFGVTPHSLTSGSNNELRWYSKSPW